MSWELTDGGVFVVVMIVSRQGCVQPLMGKGMSYEILPPVESHGEHNEPQQTMRKPPRFKR